MFEVGSAWLSDPIFYRTEKGGLNSTFSSKITKNGGGGGGGGRGKFYFSPQIMKMLKFSNFKKRGSKFYNFEKTTTQGWLNSTAG